jgi:hypothetical protein
VQQLTHKFKYKGVKNGRSKRIDETGKAEK